MNRRDLLRALAAAPLLALPFSGMAKGSRSTIAAAFGRMPAPNAIHKVIAAGSPAAVLVYVLAPHSLQAWPWKISDEARRLLPNVRADLPTMGRLAGRGSTTSTESLLVTAPDLILDAGTVDPTYLSGAERVWRQTKLPYALIDGKLPEHPAQLRDVGRLLGVPARGETLAAVAERIFALRQTVLSRESGHARPRVYYGRGLEGMETGLDRSINMEVIDFAGARNVAAQAGQGGMTRVSMEQVLAWDPEVILTQDPEFARRVPTDPLWRTVRAVRTGRVHLAPSAPFGWLDGPPSVNRLIGVQWLLSRLYPGRHPELAPDLMRARVIAFYRDFYGSAPTPDMLKAVQEVPLREAK